MLWRASQEKPPSALAAVGLTGATAGTSFHLSLHAHACALTCLPSVVEKSSHIHAAAPKKNSCIASEHVEKFGLERESG